MRNLEMIVALKKKLENVQENREGVTGPEAGKQQQLVEKLEKMNTLLGKAKVRLEQLSSENASLKEQVAAGNQSADEATQTLNEQLAEIREENRVLSEDLAARTEEIEALQSREEALRENQELRISAFEDRIAKLETQNAELNGLRQKIDEQQKLLAAVEAEKAQLRQKNDDLTARVEELPAETGAELEGTGAERENAGIALFEGTENAEGVARDTGPDAAAPEAEAESGNLTDEETLEVLAMVEDVITDEDPEFENADDETAAVSPEDLAEAAEAMAEETLEDSEEPAEEMDLAGAAEALAMEGDEGGENPEGDPVSTTETRAAVDQAFDLKNQGGFPGSLSQLGAATGSNDPFATAEPEELGGGPLVATSTPRPAGLDADLAMKAQEATDAFQQNRFAEAEKLFAEVVEEDPDNVYALSNLGVVRFKLQKFPEAEEVLEKAVELDPQDAFSYETLGIVYFSQGKIDDAIEVLTKALSQDDSRWTAHNFLGIAASRKGWPEAAEKELLKAVELNPQYGDAHYNLAVLYATQQPPSFGLAAKHYRRALSLGSSRSVDLERLLDRTELAESGGAN
jgi:Tfp pilus assembly protein PilF